MTLKMFRKFFLMESAGGILLVAAAIAATVIANSALNNHYHDLLSTQILIKLDDFYIDKDLHHWINDGLMAIFFLFVTLEIKREMLVGQLSSKSKISLPVIAALGGIVVPALIYSLLNWGDDINMKGWAIPTATDIAFALGVIILLGNRIPEILKLTLVAIAIIDDLAAIVIIAFFYTDELSILPIVIALISMIILFILNKKHVHKLSPYMIIGFILWIFVLKSGIHATLAGVVLALFIPYKVTAKSNTNELIEHTPLKNLEHNLHSWVAFLILPIFALANAGISFEGLSLDLITNPLTLGIAFGLFFGKQIGVMAFTYIGSVTKLCSLPDSINWKQYYGLALMTGIGFTMSLFIGGLSFTDDSLQPVVRLGVISGSILSGVAGYLVLRLASPENNG